jgi:hypothetical protein
MKITDDMLKHAEAALSYLAACGGFDQEVAILRAALDQAARRTTPDREAWISASERVPMPSTSEVLAWNSEGWCAVVNPEYVSPAFPEYTHWMPLPTAPTSDKGD